MSFEIPVKKARSYRETLVLSSEEEEGEHIGPEVKIIEYYQDALVQLYGNLENIPPIKKGGKRVWKFTTNQEEEEEGYIRLNRSQMCLLRGETFRGNWFIYLITLPPTVTSKTDSHVGWTTNPLVDIYLLNQGKTIYKHVDRNISMAIPHWKLDRVIGPLTCEEQAQYFANIWADGTRGMKSKRDKATFLSEATDSPLYTYTEKLGEGETIEILLDETYINDKFRKNLLQELNRK